ncbi:MAG: DUF1330 domain-containing protein [Bacteroidales bacterium]|jgi:uncharacterized protein (DUF1330 family)|nr:DUF1330 domain-containing protein [Bacteroidales bacterium]
MSHYFVAQLKIHNQATYDKYREKVDEVFDQFKGKCLVIDDHPQTIEGKWNYNRFVIIEFPDENELKRWYYSPQYQEILKFRLAGATSDTIIAAGLEEE